MTGPAYDLQTRLNATYRTMVEECLAEMEDRRRELTLPSG